MKNQEINGEFLRNLPAFLETQLMKQTTNISDINSASLEKPNYQIFANYCSFATCRILFTFKTSSICFQWKINQIGQKRAFHWYHHFEVNEQSTRCERFHQARLKIFKWRNNVCLQHCVEVFNPMLRTLVVFLSYFQCPMTLHTIWWMMTFVNVW